MINFNFSLSWPRKQTDSTAKHYFHKEGKLWGTRYWEIQFSKIGEDLLGFTFSFNPTGRDHAGLYIEFNFLGRMLAFDIHDSRHWNSEEHRWYKPGEETW